MSKCAVCESESFELQDGLYYCSNCQTQSQDLLEEEAEDGGMSGYSSSSSMRFEIRTKKLRKAKDEIDLGEQWTTYDAYNLVLKKQVDAMIALGASTKLKPAVLNLWVLYLEKTGATGPGAMFSKNCKQQWAFSQRDRDVQVILGNSRKLESISHAKKLHANRKKKRKAGRVEMTLESGPDAILSADEKSIESLEDSDSTQSSTFNGLNQNDFFSIQKLPKSSSGYCIKRMKLSRTLSFIYLGLLLVRDQILLSDVIRWLWEDRIPLYNLQDVFPGSMKFQTWDNQTFRMLHSITSNGIRSDAEKLGRFLSISKVPTIPLQYIAARFVKELNLPAFMHMAVSTLIQSLPPTSKRKYLHLPDNEGRALACIIVALKLMNRLNDAAECDLFNSKCFGNDSTYFLYNEWRKCMFIRRELHLHNWLRALRHKVCQWSVDFDALVSFYEEKAHKWKGRYCTRRVESEKSRVAEICDILCRPFSLLKRSTVWQTWTIPTPSSFPLNVESREVLTKIARGHNGHLSNDLKLMEQRILECVKIVNWTQHSSTTTLSNLSCECEAKNQWYHLESTERPVSFYHGWLLELCADIFEMKQDSIYEHVITIENMLLEE